MSVYCCSSQLASTSVSNLILRLEQQQVAMRPPPHHRLLSKLTRRRVTTPANGPQVATVATTNDDDCIGEPASRQPPSPEAEIDRRSRVRQTSASERSAHAQNDVSDDVSIASSQRQNSEAFNKVCYVHSSHCSNSTCIKLVNESLQCRQN